MKSSLLIQYLFFLGSLTAIFSCQKPPEYDNTPNIKFQNVEIFSSVENGFKKDSLVIVTRFEDGDGDLGLSNEDIAQAPFNQGDNNLNYFIEILIKKGNGFQPLNLPFSFNGRFFRLAPDGRIGPIEGDLRYGGIVIRERDNVIKPGDVLKFRVWVRDRALNRSNTVLSDEITVLK